MADGLGMSTILNPGIIGPLGVSLLASLVPYRHELETTLGDDRGNLRPAHVWSSLFWSVGPRRQ